MAQTPSRPRMVDSRARRTGRRALGILATLTLSLVPVLAWAGGEKATKLEAVADTRDMGPGFTRFMAETYNANLYLFGLYVVLIMAGMGVILGYGVDKLIALTGIDLGKMDHHE